MSYANVERIAGRKEPQVFDRFWNLVENWVEEPNSRRKGTSGVIRTTFNGETVYVKKQLNHLHYSLRHPLGRPTALREYEAIMAVKRLGLIAPDVIYCESQLVGSAFRTVLVTRALAGYLPLEEFVAQAAPLQPSEILDLIKAVAKTLAILHRDRWQHSALHAKHIFVSRQDADFRVALIDLEKMRRRPTVKGASSHDLDQLSRHQRCWGPAEWAHFQTTYQRILVRNE